MQTTKLFYIGVALLMVGCSAENASEESGRVPVRLGYSVVQADVTRAAQDLNDGHFAVSDKIKVGISNAGADSYEYYDYAAINASTGAMAPASNPQPYYPLDGTKIDIVAYYPATAGTSSSFTVKSDQTLDEAYKASDLMWTNTDGDDATLTNLSMTTDARTLKFHHQMAKIMVNATPGTGVTTITSVTLKNIKPTVTFSQTAGIDYDTNPASGTTTDILMSNNGAALIPEQTISGTFLEIATNAGNATYSLSTAKVFEAGKAYTLNISVNTAAIGTTNNISGWIGESAVELEIGDITDVYTYDGTAKTPEPTVTCNGATLTKGTDYVLTYYDNVNAGTATVAAVGLGDYALCGAVKTFVIDKADGANIEYETTVMAVVANNGNFTNELTNSGDGVVEYTSNTPSVATIDNLTGEVTIVGAGTTTITATITDGVNYTYDATTSSYTLQVIAIPTTLETLKSAINAGADCSMFIGYKVNSAGAIGATSVSGTHIGYVACVKFEYNFADYDFQESRILVIGKTDAGTNLKWGSSGICRNVETTRRRYYGYGNTNTLQSFGQEAHPAAFAAWNYDATLPSGASHWFQPTKWQMEQVKNNWGNVSFKDVFNMDGRYCLSNETGTDYISTLNFVESEINGVLQDWTFSKSVSCNVRSCFVY
ncbi:MAG: fimbrillin family protein [Prevotella sp.]|nr:fimbrillin family protein [Prevotella sp.]